MQRTLYSILTLLISLQLTAQTGKLLLVGGGTEGSGPWADAPFQWAVEQSANKKVAIIGYSSPSNFYVDYFESLGAVEATEIRIDLRELADVQSTYDALMKYDVFFFRGGDQAQYYELYKGTKTEQAIEDKFAEGGVIAGTSAGLAILSEVVFTAENDILYPDQALENPFHPNVTLRDDFLDLPLGEGFVFDSHFIERGRFPRLVNFMANWKLTNGQDLVGIGVDDKTALAIDANGQAEVYGSGTVSVYRSADFSLNDLGSVSVDALEVIQLIHGDVMDWHTLEVAEETFDSVSKSVYSEESLVSTILLGGSNDLEESSGFLTHLLEDSAPDESIVVVGHLTTEELTALEVRLKAAGLGGTVSHILPNGMTDPQMVLDLIYTNRHFLFYQIENDDFLDFLNQNVSGDFLRLRLLEEDAVTGFLGEAASWAGHSLAVNLVEDGGASFYGDFEIRFGMALLLSMTIVADTYDDTSTDFYENKSAIVPYILLQDGLERGLWLNRGNFVKMYPDETLNTYWVEAFAEEDGAMPVMHLSRPNRGESVAFDFVNQVSTGEGAIREVAGFEGLHLSFLPFNEPIAIGGMVTNIGGIEQRDIQVFPNPTVDWLRFSGLNSSNKYLYRLFDLQGKMLKNGALEEKKGVDLRSLPSGVYFCNLRSVDGRERFVEKVVKH